MENSLKSKWEAPYKVMNTTRQMSQAVKEELEKCGRSNTRLFGGDRCSQGCDTPARKMVSANPR